MSLLFTVLMMMFNTQAGSHSKAMHQKQGSQTFEFEILVHVSLKVKGFPLGSIKLSTQYLTSGWLSVRTFTILHTSTLYSCRMVLSARRTSYLEFYLIGM